MSNVDGCAGPRPRRRTKRVMLIGWEGADWRLMEPLLEAGRMPHLARMIESGTMGILASPIPLVCPILWTSIATGVFGDKHRILGAVEPDGRGDVRPVQSTSRRRKALWNVLSRNGMRSAVIGWPATHPAEPIQGIVVTDRFPQASGPAARLWPADERTVHPKDALDRIMKLRVSADDVSPAQIASFVRGLDETAAGDRRVASVAMRIAQAASAQNAATWAAQHAQWDFMAVHYGMLGGLCHEFMKYRAPREDSVSDRDADLFGEIVDTGYRLHDKMLGRMLELAGDETLVILVSDHGFRAKPVRIAPERIEHFLELFPCEPRWHYLRYHRRDAVFCAAGPGVKKDELVIGGRITDVFPTILAALELPLPADMDGRILEGIFENAPAVTHIESYEPPDEKDGTHPGDLIDDPWMRQEIIDDLSATGFAVLDAQGASALEVCSGQRDINLAEILVYRGWIAEALRIYRLMLERDDSFSVRVPIVKCLILLDRLAEAEEALEHITFLRPDSAVPNLLWAMLHAARGDLELAESYLDRAKEAEIPNDDVLMQLGAVGLRLGRWEKAKTFFERALGDDPLSAGAHDGLGVALLQLGRVEEAVSHGMLAVRLLYRSSRAHQHLGEALLAAGRPERAVRAFEAALELHPSNTEAARHLRKARRNLAKGGDASGRLPMTPGEGGP